MVGVYLRDSITAHVSAPFHIFVLHKCSGHPNLTKITRVDIYGQMHLECATTSLCFMRQVMTQQLEFLFLFYTFFLMTGDNKFLDQAESLIQNVHDTLGKDRKLKNRLDGASDNEPTKVIKKSCKYHIIICALPLTLSNNSKYRAVFVLVRRTQKAQKMETVSIFII